MHACMHAHTHELMHAARACMPASSALEPAQNDMPEKEVRAKEVWGRHWHGRLAHTCHSDKIIACNIISGHTASALNLRTDVATVNRDLFERI